MSCAEGESPRKLIPVIRNDAFRNNTAITLLRSEGQPLNDHGLIQDSRGTWHLFAIASKTDGGFSLGNSLESGLAHATAPSIPAEMERHQDVLIAKEFDSCSVWAPHAIEHQETVYLFFTDAQICENAAAHVFKMKLATASPDNLFDWTLVGTVFEDIGFTRDPFLLRDEAKGLWRIYYNRKIEPDVPGGMTAVSFKTSTDLIHWSEETFNIMDDIPDTQIFAGAAESPQVIYNAGYYYLFFTHPAMPATADTYTETAVYRSQDPTSFGSFMDRIATVWTHAPEILRLGNDWFITHTGDPGTIPGGVPGFRVPGVEMAPLDWIPDPR